MARELGLISCAEMVQAFLDDRKSETRRIEGLKVLSEHPSWWKFLGWTNPKHGVEARFYNSRQRKTEAIKPRYQVGDHLWIRETHFYDKNDQVPEVFYRADFSDADAKGAFSDVGDKWISPYFMPKRAARIWREVAAIKDPHRLQDISPEECIAEGIEVSTAHGEPAYYLYDERLHYTPSPVESFQTLWDRLHPEPGERWGDNPWVLPYVLKIQEKPI